MLRRGEILALRDRDLDLEAASISVFAQHQEGARVATKTRAGLRTVDVAPQAVRLFAEQQAARSPSPDDYLFRTAPAGLRRRQLHVAGCSSRRPGRPGSQS